MVRTILKRLLEGIVVVFFIVSLTFFLVRAMPGNPLKYGPDGKELPEHIVRKNKEYYKLDRPLIVQYGYFMGNILKGDLGPSMSKEGRSVSMILGQSFPASVTLGLAAMCFALAVGIPAGCISAFKKNTWLDFASMTFAMIGVCVPAFVIGPICAYWLATKLGILNLAGWEHPQDIILPSITLGIATAAYIARLTRAGMLEVLSSDYIRTAHAKGVSQPKIIIKHALKGGLIPAVAFVGPAFAALISGSFVVETIFQVPGMGQHFINAALARDYNMLQGLVLLFGILIVIANLTADVVLVLLNPKLQA